MAKRSLYKALKRAIFSGAGTEELVRHFGWPPPSANAASVRQAVSTGGYDFYYCSNPDCRNYQRHSLMRGQKCPLCITGSADISGGSSPNPDE